MPGLVRIVPYSPEWPRRFAHIARELRAALGDLPHSIHHIGSTAVPGLASKDRIDVQITLASEADVPALRGRLREAGLPDAEPNRDHRPPGDTSPASEWEKFYIRGVDLGSAQNTHVRFLGRRNREYPLLFRDYLRGHPEAAAAYGAFKVALAAELGDRRDRYTDLKDPVCDLVMVEARGWAARAGWEPGPDES